MYVSHTQKTKTMKRFVLGPVLLLSLFLDPLKKNSAYAAGDRLNQSRGRKLEKGKVSEDLCPAGQAVHNTGTSCVSFNDCPVGTHCEIYEKVCCDTTSGCPADEPPEFTPCTSIDTCSYGMECNDRKCSPERICVCSLGTYLCFSTDEWDVIKDLPGRVEQSFSTEQKKAEFPLETLRS